MPPTEKIVVLEQIFAALTLPVIVLDRNFDIVMTNPATVPYLEDLQRLVARTKLLIESKSYPCDTDPNFVHTLVALHGNHQQTASLQCQWLKGQRRITLHVEISQQSDDSGHARYIISLTDVTPLIEARSQMAHAAKLASIGEIAAGVAHELNQPLNVIRMSSQNLMRSAQRGQLTAEIASPKLERIGHQVERAADIIESLRAFGRRADYEPQYIAASATIAEGAHVIVNQLRSMGISVDHRPLAEDVHILANASAIEQIIVSLMTNARDAVQLTDPDNPWIHIHESNEAGWFTLVIEDNGGGIAPDAIDHIFEPFFSTKKVGSATGLGLSITYGVLADIGGSIQAHNTASGACFTLRIPIAG